MSDVLFRVNAGRVVGLGHLQRCLSLSAAFAREGVRSHWLIDEDSGTVRYLAQDGVSAAWLSPALSWSHEDAARTLAVARAVGARAVIVDAPEIPVDYLLRLREGGLFVIVRDDLARGPFTVPMVINGNADASELPYVSIDQTTQFLLGPAYAVLREEFWAIPPRVVRDSVQEVLVMLGGADAHGLMARLLSMLDELPEPFAVTAVIGPFFTNRDTMYRAAAGLRRRVQRVESPNRVAKLMQEADVAISAAGQTLYELACVGCAGIALQVSPDQAGQLQAMVRAGCVRSVGEATAGDPVVRIREALTNLLHDPSARTGMVRAGQRLIDGQGARRVVQAILDSGAFRVALPASALPGAAPCNNRA